MESEEARPFDLDVLGDNLRFSCGVLKLISTSEYRLYEIDSDDNCLNTVLQEVLRRIDIVREIMDTEQVDRLQDFYNKFDGDPVSMADALKKLA